jgi:hypothetical protein
MSIFSLDQHTATVKSLTYVTDWSGNRKSSFVSTWASAVGYLTPIGINNQNVWLDRFWQAWNFETEYPFTIKETDILTIDGVDYDVKSFARVKGINIDRVRVVLTLTKNE